MKTPQPQKLVTAAAVLALIVTTTAASAQKITTDIPPSITTPDKVETGIGTLEFKDGAPTAATAQKVRDSLDYIRGVDAFMNAFSGASAFAIRKGFQSIGAEDNTVVMFSELMDSASLFLTPNADTVYSLAALDLTKGPLVVEAPPAQLGTINDMWFGWVIDIGFPGPDRGEGGKYLIVPPGYDGPLPDSGFHVGHSKTTHALYAVRAFMENNDPKPTAASIRNTLKIYPYTPGGYGTSIATALEGKVPLARNPPVPPTKFVEASGKSFNTVPPTDFSYFEMLNELVQMEPATSFNPEVSGQLAAIGIVKGKPFNPDARMRKILTDAAAVGNAAGRVLNWGAADYPGWAYYPNSMWASMLWQGGYNFETPPPMVTKDGIEPLPPTGADARFAGGVLLRVHDGHTGDDHAADQRRLAVSDGLHRCRQESLRRGQDLQGDAAEGHSRGQVLVGHLVRQPDPLNAPNPATVPTCRKPDISVAGCRRERGWLHHRVFRPHQAGRREGRRLDPDDARKGLLRDPAALQPARIVLRQKLEAERGRVGEMNFPIKIFQEANAMDIKKVLIVGSGTLGQQIGFQCATHGFETVMYDVREQSLDACRASHRAFADLFISQRGKSKADMDAALARLSYTTDLEAACRDVDLVSESVPENPKIKEQVYGSLQKYCPAHTIFTTNTSTLLPSQFAGATGRPDRFLALHFANEIWDRNVAEVMGHPGTDPTIYERVVEFAKAIGMVPVRLEKEQNGYVMNSLSIPWMMAAQALVTNGVSEPEVIDKTWMITMKTAMGPCAIMDMVGLETMYHVASYWGEVNADEQYKKNAEYLKAHFVDRNRLGVKTGQGYYKYPNPAYQEPDFLR